VVKVANSSARAALNKGETVKIGWNIEDCRALDPSG
jgi:hypothetical protein